MVEDKERERMLAMSMRRRQSFSKEWDEARLLVLHGLRKREQTVRSVSGRRFT